MEEVWDSDSLWLSEAMGGKDALTSFSLESKGDTQWNCLPAAPRIWCARHVGLHKHMYTNVLKSNHTRAIMHLSDLLKHSNIFFSHSFEPRTILYAQQFTIYVKGHLTWRHFSEEIEFVMTGKKLTVQEDAFRLCGKKWYNQHVKFNWRLK